MKKLLVAFGWLFFAGFASAATLTGVVQDALTNKPLLDVSVAVGSDKNSPEDNTKTNKNGEFELDFTFDPQNPAKIWFSKDKYEDLVGTLSIENGKLIYRVDNTFIKNDLGEYQENNTYDLGKISIEPTPVPIIRGIITIENKDEKFVFEKNVQMSVSGFANGEMLLISLKCDGELECKYEVSGQLGTAKNPRKYDLWFHYGDENDKTYEDIEIPVEVKDTLVEDGADIVFEKITLAKRQEENMKNITGFGCNDTMPRYLVGANCVENSTLEGNATDLAALLQKFGGKITGLISMIAVLLIVYNGLVIVTAAGETEKISQGKKGIMWTIIGLAVTMFAYVIVKTVIMFAYGV